MPKGVILILGELESSVKLSGAPRPPGATFELDYSPPAVR
jgi:hypothetical protein